MKRRERRGVARRRRVWFSANAAPGWAILILQCGCVGDARVGLAAADSIDVLTASLGAVLAEYHADIERSDDSRERTAVMALVERLRVDMGDQAKTDAHTNDLLQALERVHADRRVAYKRYTASRDNVSALREVAEGLRRLAIESLSMKDEAERYFTDLLELWRAERAEPGDESNP